MIFPSYRKPSPLMKSLPHRKTRTSTINPIPLPIVKKEEANTTRFKGYGSDSENSIPPAASPFKILLVLDYNGTLNKNFDGIIKVIRQYRNNLVVLINTGRSLDWIQKDVKKRKSELRSLPVDALATHDGTELYLNTAAQRFVRWVAVLTPNSQDKEWVNNRERSSGWQSIHMILNIVNRALANLPSILTTQSPQQVVKTRKKDPGDPKFYVESLENSLHVEQEVKKELTRQMTNESQSSGRHIQTDIIVEDSAVSSSGQSVKKFILKPKGYTKKTPIEFMVERNPSILHIIPAGNGSNDIDMLESAFIAGKPNHGFVCKGGKDEPELRQKLTGKAHISFIPQTSLDQAIESEIKEILKQKKPMS